MTYKPHYKVSVLIMTYKPNYKVAINILARCSDPQSRKKGSAMNP